LLNNNAFDHTKFTLFFSLSLHTLAPQAILSDGNIINILDLFIGEPPDPLRKSLSNLVSILDGLTNILTYLKFVDREKEVNQLMMNMEKLHYTLLKIATNIQNPKRK